MSKLILISCQDVEDFAIPKASLHAFCPHRDMSFVDKRCARRHVRKQLAKWAHMTGVPQQLKDWAIRRLQSNAKAYV